MDLNSDYTAVDSTFVKVPQASQQGGEGHWSLTAGDSLRLDGSLLDKRTNKIFLLNDSVLILQGYSGPAQLQFIAYQKGF